MLDMNIKQYKRATSKGDMIKVMQWQKRQLDIQQAEITKLNYIIYMRDLLYNPCHESERMTHER